MANYYWCTVLCLLVLFCGIFDCRNINNRRQNKVKKCNKIENFYGGNVVYFGNREVGTEVYYSCEDDYTQQPEDRDSSMCTETGHGAIWVPDPPDCLEMAVVQIPKNGFTDAVAAIIEHGQSYNIFCHIGYELYRGRFYNTDNITITNYNGTLKPKIPGCKPARCDPLSLNETIVSYLNGTEITDLIPSGTKVMYSCIPGYEFRNENFDAGVIGRCKLGEFRRIPKCIPSCMVPDDNRYHYKNAEGKDVASGKLIDNGETLKVTCLIGSDDYDYYASNDSDIQLDTVTCYNGSLSKTDLECDEDKSGQCLDLENGKVTVTGGYRYHVQCNTGYTLDIDMPEVHCACNDGTLSCFNQVPVCKPDNCLISLNHDMSIMSVKVNGVDMAGGSMVSHASHVVFDCHQQGNDVYEPKNRHFTCKAGKWIKGDRSDKLWKYNNNGTFPECIRVARNCTLPRWTNASKVSVPNTDKSLLSENIAVKDGEQLEIDCGVPVLLKMRYICKDGIWQQQGNKTFEHVKNGHISNCTVMIGHQGLRQFVELINGTFNAIKAWIHHLVSQIETD